MKMNFFVLSQLLSTTKSLVTAGYFIFGLSLLFIFIQPKFELLNLVTTCAIFTLVGIHHFLFVRVKLDAAILKMLFKQSQHKTIEELTIELDHSLVSLSLMPQSKIGRTWQQRFQGCFKLYKLQVVIFAFQVLGLFSCILINKIQ